MNETKHRAVIGEFLAFVNANQSPYILKGGTSLMECYGLDRFSEDIDLDCQRSAAASDAFRRRIERFCDSSGYGFRIAKSTETVSRAFIRYPGGDKPLKVEVSYRRGRIERDAFTEINGIKVYTISEIAIQKAGAYLARDKIRDLYDLTFIVNEYANDLLPGALSAVTNAFEYKDLDQFDYLVRTQDDPLIDKEKLLDGFLRSFETLGILSPSASSVDVCVEIAPKMILPEEGIGGYPDRVD